MSAKEVVKPYEGDASKKVQIKEMFDNVAGRYDALNRLLSLGVDISWRKRLIKEMKAYAPKHIVDMATGTADLAIMAAKSLPHTRISGIDLSPNMVSVGDKKVISAGLQDQVALSVGDSEGINQKDATYDGAMVSFGVRNFEDLKQGLSELHRVLQPGKPLMVLEFTKPTIFPVKQVFNLYFRLILPTIGKLFSKDKNAYTYLYDSVQAFPGYDEFQSIMEEVGFKNCRWHALTFGICCLYIGEK